MKLKLLTLVFFAHVFTGFAQWTNLETGINDNLNGVVFFGENGIMSGENGLYYTANGGQNATSWSRFEIANNAADQMLYNNTKFNHCAAAENQSGSGGFVYACGVNTVTNKAVVMEVNISSLAYHIQEIDIENSMLNRISYMGYMYATGNNGLLVKLSFPTIEIISTGISDNLHGISGSTNNARLAAENKLFKMESVNGENITFTELPTPGFSNTAIEFPNSYQIFSAGNQYATFDTSGVPTINPNYDFGPLNATALTLRSGYHFVATDHGIFRTSNPAGVLEFQPSSGTTAINEMWSQNNSAPIYACGPNGILLKTTNFGGPTKPYAGMTITGGCLNGITNFKSLYSGAQGGEWLLDGAPFGSGSNINYIFTQPGSYVVTLTVTNAAGNSDVKSKTINITPYPNVTLPVTINDVILCKSEPLIIEIGNSEQGVRYILKKQGDTNAQHYGSTQGNGGTLLFSSNPLTQTGDYYLQAQNVSSSCALSFPDIIPVQVEQTAAIFHSGRINAEVGESVPFYGNPVEADTFAYNFSAAATVTTPNQISTQATFSTPGEITSTYTVTSPNGCEDQRSQPFPWIYETPNSAECFLLQNNSRDPDWPGHYNRDIAQMKPVTGGYLICGTYMDQVFDSKKGKTFGLPGKKGGYLAKYDLYGAIKWIVYTTTNPGNMTQNDNNFGYTAEDSQGNIYVSGLAIGVGDNVIFHDNTGKQTVLSGYSNKFIVKLSGEGELLWRMESVTTGFGQLAVDQDDNLIAVTGHSIYNSFINLNGTEHYSEDLNQYSYYLNYGISKFSPNGTYIWEKKIYLNSANVTQISDIGIDAENNIYAAMNFDGYARIYQTSTNDYVDIPGINGEYGSKIGLLKLDENANILWTMRSRSDVNFGDTTIAYKMLVEPDGTLYVTGQNDCGTNFYPQPETHIFENTDGSVTTTSRGPFFVAKISSDGICNWIRASSNSFYGTGSTMLKTGNELYIVGQASENGGSEFIETSFDSSDGVSGSTSISTYSYFIVVYDIDGNLKRIMLNNDGTNAVNYIGFTGFFRGENGQFYLSKNVWPYDATLELREFGLTATLNGRDGIVSRFNENCAIISYDAALNTKSDNTSEIILAPNPTNGHFAIDLGEIKSEIHITISDISGKIITDELFHDASNVALTTTGEEGIYFVKVSADNTIKIFKLIKQ